MENDFFEDLEHREQKTSIAWWNIVKTSPKSENKQKKIKGHSWSYGSMSDDSNINFNA